MKRHVALLPAFLPLLLSACGTWDAKPAETQEVEAAPQPTDDESAILGALARLDLADQFAANQQRMCAANPQSRLGSMGTPVKLMIGDQAVFVCCRHCQALAQASPGVALANARALRGPDIGLPTP